MSQFGIDRARELAAESHRMAREALAEVPARRERNGRPGDGRLPATAELEGIADFIFTRTS